ncbi:MAG: hypothetical protein WC980_03690 [Candidatus Brocadiia bacterium]
MPRLTFIIVLLTGLMMLTACQSGTPPIATAANTEDTQMQARGFQKVQGEWMSNEEINGFILDENGVSSDYTQITPPVGLCLTAALNYQPMDEEIDKVKQSFHRFSLLVWNDTWGNMYIKKAVFKTNATHGYISLEKLERGQGGHAYFGGVFTVSTNLLDIGNPEMGKRILAAGILHEFGHSMFHLPDEYPYKGQPDMPVRKCVMDPRSHYTGLCIDCEQRILARFKNFSFPAEEQKNDWDKSHPAPETYFVVK